MRPLFEKEAVLLGEEDVDQGSTGRYGRHVHDTIHLCSTRYGAGSTAWPGPCHALPCPALSCLLLWAFRRGRCYCSTSHLTPHLLLQLLHNSPRGARHMCCLSASISMVPEPSPAGHPFSFLRVHVAAATKHRGPSETTCTTPGMTWPARGLGSPYCAHLRLAQPWPCHFSTSPNININAAFSAATNSRRSEIIHMHLATLGPQGTQEQHESSNLAMLASILMNLDGLFWSNSWGLF